MGTSSDNSLVTLAPPQVVEHQNYLGTERMRTMPTGPYNSSSPNYAVEATFAEQPFGDNKQQTLPGGADTDANHYAFLDTDKETATDHADFRQYSNAQGRWMAPDPISTTYNWRNPQTFNRYVYAANSPLSTIDPSGQSCVYVSREDGHVTIDPAASAQCNSQDGWATQQYDYALDPFRYDEYWDSNNNVTVVVYNAPNPWDGHFMAQQVFQGEFSGEFVAANTAVTDGTVGYAAATLGVVAAPVVASTTPAQAIVDGFIASYVAAQFGEAAGLLGEGPGKSLPVDSGGNENSGESGISGGNMSISGSAPPPSGYQLPVLVP